MTNNNLDQSIIYVTRDIERALGHQPQKSFYIIANETPFAKRLSVGNPNIVLVSKPTLLDTHELLQLTETKKFINSIANPRLLVFKNTELIERICKRNNWKLLNPDARLATNVEEKISQLDWLGALKKFLPPHQVILGKDLEWKKENIIIQFNRAHTGSGTLLIKSPRDTDEIRKKFPKRPIRVTKFIDGPCLTSNNVVWDGEILHGPIMYQITGLSPFTQNKFATIGNDWQLGNKLLDDPQWNNYKAIVEGVGRKLMADGWRGLFGIDAILDQASGEIYLIEINARQPASTTYESILQGDSTTFEAHLSALLGLPKAKFVLTSVIEGAQIIQRVPQSPLGRGRGGLANRGQKSKVQRLESLGLNVIEYANTEPEKDLLRIQSKEGIMLAHNQLNELGKKIAAILK
ncbi:MAG: hypothetical protein AAB467_02255 [Patescibacteria group bacterium]